MDKNCGIFPDGKIIACAGDEETVYIYDVGTGERLKTLTGHDRYINAVAFAPDGRTLASASNDRTIRLWDINTGAPLKTLNINVSSQQSHIRQMGKHLSVEAPMARSSSGIAVIGNF